jgi:hypothetical protein
MHVLLNIISAAVFACPMAEKKQGNPQIIPAKQI